MKVQEIRAMSDKEIDEKIRDLKQELFNLRFQLATGQLDNVMRIREVKRAIARVKTIKRERELGRGKGEVNEVAR
ncbi:MAG TPA: 50S ribosomal protein L29 [Firmicutes bacterium]|nr:50S ribosomal protein L29 [Candidatus Fermentithermobacillaceae bacterium]